MNSWDVNASARPNTAEFIRALDEIQGYKINKTIHSHHYNERSLDGLMQQQQQQQQQQRQLTQMKHSLSNERINPNPNEAYNQSSPSQNIYNMNQKTVVYNPHSHRSSTESYNSEKIVEETQQEEPQSNFLIRTIGNVGNYFGITPNQPQQQQPRIQQMQRQQAPPRQSNQLPQQPQLPPAFMKQNPNLGYNANKRFSGFSSQMIKGEGNMNVDVEDENERYYSQNEDGDYEEIKYEQEYYVAREK
jgi:hypothetical protein